MHRSRFGMTRPRLAIGTSALLSVALVGCSSSSKTASSPSSSALAPAATTSASAPSAPAASTPAVSSPAASSSVASAPPAKSTVTSVTVQDYYNYEPDQSIYGDVLNACGASIGVKIQRDIVPGASYIPKVLQEGSSHTLPDVLMLDNPDVQHIASTGALTPLSQFGLSASGSVAGVVAASTYQGQLYGFQPVANTIALFYKKDALSKAGVTPPTTSATANRSKSSSPAASTASPSPAGQPVKPPGRPAVHVVKRRRRKGHRHATEQPTRCSSGSTSSRTVPRRSPYSHGRRATCSTSSRPARQR